MALLRDSKHRGVLFAMGDKVEKLSCYERERWRSGENGRIYYEYNHQ